MGIHFVSLSESLDTSTPAGKMVLTVLGAVAELERSSIVERAKGALRNAQAKDKRLGRPQAVLDAKWITALRAPGLGWKRIAADLGVGVGTVIRYANGVQKFRKMFLEPACSAFAF
jgi:DNA invertase Pin-like site-specific DNA recombinase